MSHVGWDADDLPYQGEKLRAWNRTQPPRLPPRASRLFTISPSVSHARLLSRGFVLTQAMFHVYFTQSDTHNRTFLPLLQHLPPVQMPSRNPPPTHPPLFPAASIISSPGKSPWNI